jgi:hypothetical protein
VPKFRKKPVVIEAVQLTWSNWNAICDFVPKPWFVKGVWLGKDGKPLPDDQYTFSSEGATGNGNLGLLMQTLESEQFLATGDDWIIKGVKGEFYPCKPDVFAATYEPVSDT